MIPISPVPQPPSKKELLGLFKEVLSKLVKEDVTSDVEPERLWQYRQTSKADLYWRSLQYISPHLFEGGMSAFSSVGSPIAGSGAEGQATGLYDYCQNIYRGYGRKFVGAVGLRAPNVKAVPDDPNDEVSQKRSRNADVAAQILGSKWDVDQRNLELAMHLWKSGTTFAYTPWVTNGSKYGKTDSPKIESRSVPMGDQGDNVDVPEVVGTASYENGAVEFHLCNIFTVSTPFFAHDLTDTPWLSYEFDEYKGKLLQAYPQMRDQGSLENFGDDSASSGVGSTARDTAASPVGIPTPRRTTRWRYTRVWLKPEVYENVDDSQTTPPELQPFVESNKLRDGLKRFYPDGVKITMIQGQVVDVEPEKLEDVWAMCKPETSEYIFADSIGQDLLQTQDLKNDMLNIGAETLERGLPMTFVHPDTVDVEAWARKTAMPCEIMPAVPALGNTLGDNFFQTQPAEFSGQMMPWMAGNVEEAREIIGVVPAIFGGDEGSQTAREAEIKKNAALQQLGVPWLMMRKFHAAARTNGVKQLARYGSGMMRSVKEGTQGYESLMLDVSELQEDGWHFEAEEAIPMTWGQMRDLLMFMLEKPPQVLQAFGFMHPWNVAKNQSLLGMTGYFTPGLDDRDKALDVIGKLLNAKPIQKPNPDGSTDFQPSIPIDQFEDDHQLTMLLVKAWCQTPAGRRARDSNGDGYANVVAWGKAHATALNPPPPPPPPIPPAKMNISAKWEQLDPATQQSILKDFVPGAPVAPPGPPAPNAPPPPALPPGGPPGAAPSGAAGPPPEGPMGAQPLPSQVM